MRAYAKLVVVITVFTVLVILYANPPKTAVDVAFRASSRSTHAAADENAVAEASRVVSIWISVTKIARGHLLTKFRKFFRSLVGRRGGCRAVFELNVITDNASRPTVDGVIRELLGKRRRENRDDALLTVRIKSLSLLVNTFFRPVSGPAYRCCNSWSVG